jgi:very-short-patch-repair endonuclease
MPRPSSVKFEGLPHVSDSDTSSFLVCISFLTKEGLKPEEISNQTGISISTIYKYMPHELKNQERSESISKGIREKSEALRQISPPTEINLETQDTKLQPPSIEHTIIKPKETPEYRRAIMHPQHSQMEQNLLIDLEVAGYHPETDHSFCVQSTTPDFYFPDLNLAIYIDGVPHKNHEETDERLRTLLANRYHLKVLSVPYDRNTKAMEKQILDLIKGEL